MAFRASHLVSVRSIRRIRQTARLLSVPALAVGLVIACSDNGTSGGLGTGGAGGHAGAGGGGASSAGSSNPVAGSANGGSAVTAGSGGAAGAAGAGGKGGAGGTGGAGGAAGSAGNAGSGGTLGGAGMAGAAGTGGSAPVCTVPISGGADLSGLLVGPKSVEGEAATLSGAAAVVSAGSGWSGTGFADMKASEGGMIWLVDVPVAGDYVLDWTYTQNDTRDMRLSVNCVKIADSVAFTNTGSWNTNWTTGGAQKVKLAKGTNQIVLETNGGSGPNFDTLVVSPPICALAGDTATTCEAERALLSGAASLVSAGSGWKDLGFADMNGAEGGVNWVVDAPSAGSYTLTFAYAEAEARDMTLSLNGAVAVASLPFNNTTSWNNVWASDVTYDVALKKGLNSLQLTTNGKSGPNFDSVTLQAEAAGGAGGAGSGGAGGAGGAP